MPRKELIDIAATIIAETEKAWRIDDGANKVWIPKSQAEYNADDGIFTMPEWLAKEKELI